VTWKAPIGNGQTYKLYRIAGAIVDSTTFGNRVLVTTTTATAFDDDTVKAGTTYMYFLTAASGGNVSGMSQLVKAIVPK